MEQYLMPKEEDSENLRKCLDNYETERLYIRLVGSKGGNVKISENLENRSLDFRKDSSGLYLFVDNEEVFNFSLKRYHKGFSLAYERMIQDEDGSERLYIPRKVPDNPYDPSLPEPERSFLRTVLDDYLMEIFFKGRVHIDFHSWMQEPDFKYWKVLTPEEAREMQK